MWMVLRQLQPQGNPPGSQYVSTAGRNPPAHNGPCSFPNGTVPYQADGTLCLSRELGK